MDQQPKERTSEDSRRGADENMELAKILIGHISVSDQEFLERMARSAEFVIEDRETCGIACKMLIEADVARELLDAGEYEDVRRKWSAESWRRWQDSKFFKLWQQEQQAGRNPHQAFQDRGWEA